MITIRIVLQRVSQGSLLVDDDHRGTIGKGVVALVGFTGGDNNAIVDYMLSKMINLRIFDDENGNLNLSLNDVAGEVMVVSNFTLYANSKKGRRPSFIQALVPIEANKLYHYFLKKLEKCFLNNVVSGDFGSDMNVSLTNDGPVTIILDSAEMYVE